MGPLIDDRFELLDDTLKAIEQLACPGLPFVIVVEDAHDADPVLAALLEGIMKTDASVLILLTSWNGYVDSNLGILTVLAEDPSKTFRILPTTSPFPPPFPFDASFSALRPEELAPLIRRYYPQVADSTAKEVASHFPNPLALELFLQMRVRWDQNSPSSPSIESLELNTVPTELRDLYREQWNRLPKEDQRALAFASAGTLSSLSESDQAPATWNASFLEAALAKMLLSNPRQIKTTVNGSKHFAAWSTPVSDHIQQFTDRHFHEVVRQDNSQLGSAGRSDFLTKLGVAVSEAVFKDDFPDLETKRHSLQLAVALKKLGFVDEHTATRANQLLVLSAYDKSELAESLQDNDADRQTQAATMGGWGPDRELFTREAPAPYPAFNSITNNPAYGDERALFRMKPSDAPNSEYSGYLDIVPGKRYTGLIYFHNNANAAHLAMEGAKMRVAFPVVLRKTKVNGATAFLEAANATPPQVYGNVYFRTPRDLAVRYVPDSATFYSAGPLNKEHLDGRQLLGHGHLLGYDRFDGILPGGKPAQAAGYVTFEVQTHYPDFTVKLRTRRFGTGSWEPVIAAWPGDAIQIYLTYQNTGTVRQDDVVARIALPDGLTYVPGTTKMINSIAPEGAAQPDGITRQGVNIGSYGPRGNCGIAFMTTLAPDSAGKDLSVYATMITAHGNKQTGLVASVRVR